MMALFNIYRQEARCSKQINKCSLSLNHCLKWCGFCQLVTGVFAILYVLSYKLFPHDVVILIDYNVFLELIECSTISMIRLQTRLWAYIAGYSTGNVHCKWSRNSHKQMVGIVHLCRTVYKEKHHLLYTSVASKHTPGLH